MVTLSLEDFLEIFKEAVVRCRDCIYYKKAPYPIDPGWPMMCERTDDDMVTPDGFCAWGKRRES